MQSDAEEWIVIGEDNVSPYRFDFDTTTISDGEIDVRAVAYDASGNESSPMVVYYSVDNTPPEKVTGLSAEVKKTIIKLSWNNTSDSDVSHYILQKKVNGEWQTVRSKIKYCKSF